MANSSSSKPQNQVSFHLSDRTLTPIISSTRSEPQSSAFPSGSEQALSALTTAAITVFDSSSRLGLGLPQRVMVETKSRGPVLLHSYLNPQSSHAHLETGKNKGIVEQTRDELRPLSAGTDSNATAADGDERTVNGIAVRPAVEAEYGKERGSAGPQPPLLIASVVAATAQHAGKARVAAAKLERVGKEFQREFVEGSQIQNAGEDG
ncbi:hypothetical protein B0O99DRAFT_521726 [Bisporella sp. PMI_857]|nr:hypothetical protein B0O99DRAFT_521726 [Bisporella sp. PMI_857]